MNEWLVRTSNLQILGPFAKDEVIEMIRSGEILHQDEVCQANQYWFFIHEQEELQRFLGIQVPVHKTRDGTDDITETETDVSPVTRKLESTRPAGQFISPKKKKEIEFEPAASDASQPESTVMFSLDGSESIELESKPEPAAPEPAPAPTAAQSPASATPPAERKSAAPVPVTAAPQERPAVLKGLASTLIVLSLLLLWMAIQRLWDV